MGYVLFIGSNVDKPHHYTPARNRGKKIAVLKPRPNLKDREMFDKVIKADVFDSKDVLSKIKDLDIDACLTRFEPWVPLVGMICDKLKLKGPSLRSALNSRDKLIMRKAFEKAGVAQPRFMQVKSRADVKKASRYLGFPFLLKPLSGAKSRFIKKIKDEDEVIKGYEETMQYLKHSTLNLFNNIKGIDENDYRDTMIAEEVLIGKQYTTTSLIFGGNVFNIEACDLVTAQDLKREAFYLISRTTPCMLDFSQKEDLYVLASDAVKALGLDDTPVHPEMIMTRDGPKIIEVAARIGGYRKEMTEYAFGIKLNQAAVDIALGKRPDLDKRFLKAATAVEHWPTGEGIIRDIENIKEVMNRDDVKEFCIKKNIGDKYLLPPRGEKPVAHFITLGDDPMQSLGAAKEVQKLLTYSF